MSRPSVLTSVDIAAIDAAVAKLPPLTDEAIDDIAVTLAAFRNERRRIATTAASARQSLAARAGLTTGSDEGGGRAA